MRMVLGRIVSYATGEDGDPGFGENPRGIRARRRLQEGIRVKLTASLFCLILERPMPA